MALNRTMYLDIQIPSGLSLMRSYGLSIDDGHRRSTAFLLVDENSSTRGAGMIFEPTKVQEESSIIA